MKTIICFRNCVLLLVYLIYASSCSKSSSKPNTGASINGSWVTSVWGGANDTAIISISTSAGTGIMTYLNASAITATNFSVNDVIFSNITSAGNGSYAAVGEYRYGMGSQTVGHANATLTLQNNNATLYVHYAEDPNSNITPPDYYWQKH
jgi:hypothetical protein